MIRRLLPVLAVALLPLAPPVPVDRAAAQADPAVARMRADVEHLVRGGPREAGGAAERAAADHVVAVLRGLGKSPSVTEVPLANGRRSRNVETAFGGGTVEILLGAHLDTVHDSPGADDNASGVAVLLELARRYASGAAAVPPGTTVRLVWFGAEEILRGYSRDTHHAGSRQLAASRAATGRHPHWMLSVDMVGNGGRVLAVLYDGTDATAARVLEGAARAAGAPATVSARGDISDHEGFARSGSAAALLWRPDNPGYHGPGDTQVVDGSLAASLRTAETFVAAAASPFVTGRGLAHLLIGELLFRRPDVGGAGHWSARLDAGAGAGEVGAALLASPEWTLAVAPAARVYLAAFGRHADAAGLSHWAGLRRAGAPLESIAGAFVASPEFRTRHGAPDDRGFVRVLYRNVLGRDADAGGEGHWVDQLRSGRMSRAAVLVAFSESAEHRARTAAALPVALAYAGLLGRPVDAAALAHWAGRPTSELVAGIVASQELRARW